VKQPRVPGGSPRGGQWTKTGSLAGLTKAQRKSLVDKLDRADANLPEVAQRAITDFVGHAPGARMGDGDGFGIMVANHIEDAYSDNPSNRGVVIRGQLEEAMKPVREELRKVIGDRIEAFRAQGEVAGNSPNRNTLSYTMDEGFANYHAGVGKDLPIISDAEIAMLDAQAKSGATVEIYKHVLKPSPAFPGSYDLYRKADEYGPESYITDSSGVRYQADDHNEWASRLNAENAARRATVQSRSVPVEDIVWATNRAGQWELIVRTKSNREGYF